LTITGSPSIGTITTTVGVNTYNLLSLSANTTYTITYTISSTTYGNTAPTSSLPINAQGSAVFSVINITATSATYYWTYTGFPDGTSYVFYILGVGGTNGGNLSNGSRSYTYQNVLTPNTNYGGVFSIPSSGTTPYGNFSVNPSFTTLSNGTLNSFNITAFNSSGLLVGWTYGNGYTSGTSATISINNTSISQPVKLGDNGSTYQFSSSTLSSLMTNYGTVYQITLSVNDANYGSASINASSSIGGSNGFMIPWCSGSDSWYVGYLATSNDQGPYGNHSYYIVYQYTTVQSTNFFVGFGNAYYDILIIGGGGAGGGNRGGGGGGGGVVLIGLQLYSPPSSPPSYSVVVGGGGNQSYYQGVNGNPSSFNNLWFANGGGGGGEQGGAPGQDGACGGGAGANTSSSPGGASGNTGVAAGGGGGNTSAGGNGNGTTGGNGGNGYDDYMFLNGQQFCGGGGGFTENGSGGGLGAYGGGNGAIGGTTRGPTNGNNGGGGGGGFNSNWGGSGGNGAVYIRQAYSF